jgi:hypothetical protein
MAPTGRRFIRVNGIQKKKKKVYVNAKTFAGERPSRSLGLKNAGPWRIIQVIDNKAYEL